MRNSPTPSTGPSPAVDADDPSATFASSFTPVPSAVRPGPVQRASASWASRDATTSRSASSASGSRITSPVVPSTITGVPVCTACRPATPTTQGMPSWRAMIAVWLVGPPRSVASPTTSAASRPAVSAGARSSASSTEGRAGTGTPGSGSPTMRAVTRRSMSRRSVTRSAIRPPIWVKMPANCSTPADSATSSGSPALSRLRTAARNPLSRASPAVAASTSAAAPLAAAARAVRPSAVAAAAASYAARAASASSSVFSKAATAVAETATVATTAGAYATPGTTGVPRRAAVAGEAPEVCDMRPTVKATPLDSQQKRA